MRAKVFYHMKPRPRKVVIWPGKRKVETRHNGKMVISIMFKTHKFCIEIYNYFFPYTIELLKPVCYQNPYFTYIDNHKC